jgi:hypothetical protein
MVDYPEPQYAVLTYKEGEIQEKDVFNLKYDALTYIGGLKEVEYVFIGWMEIKKGSKLLWVIQDNFVDKVDDSVILQKINNYMFSFDESWISEWT